MYRLAICEDEPHLLEQMRALCSEILSQWGIEYAIETFLSADSLEEAISGVSDRFDLLILDIGMQGKSGMQLAHELRGRDDRVSIIFATSSEAHLREGYDVQPIQYLLKPVKKEALVEALKTDIKVNHSPKTIVLRMGLRTVVFPICDICYIESLGHNVVFHLLGEERAFVLSLTEAERLAPTERFCRCHKSYLVNMEHIAEITRTEIVLHNGEKIPVGRKYYADVQAAFVRYMNP